MMRKNIWEINNMLLCPVTGYCLSSAEQQTIIRKYVPKEKQILVTKRFHDFLIGAVSSKTKIAKHVQKILDNKYSNEISKCSNFDANKWMMEIENFLNYEDFGAFIWISAVYQKLDKIDVERIMYKIHMYSHQMYFELQEVASEHLCIREQSMVLNEKYRNIRIKQKMAAKEISALKASNIQIIHENSALLREVELFRNKHPQENNTIRKWAVLEQQIEYQEKTIAILKKENKQLTKEASSQLSVLIDVRKDFDNILDQLKEHTEKCKKCDRVDLCQQRVLIVGGITKMESFYRKLVHELGGDFYYHDGYCRQDESVLANLVNQSDIVICPVDVNSHAACLQVKKACKKTGTDFYMLRKSSVSTVYNTLMEVASA